MCLSWPIENSLYSLTTWFKNSSCVFGKYVSRNGFLKSGLRSLSATQFVSYSGWAETYFNNTHWSFSRKNVEVKIIFNDKTLEPSRNQIISFWYEKCIRYVAIRACFETNYFLRAKVWIIWFHSNFVEHHNLETNNNIWIISWKPVHLKWFVFSQKATLDMEIDLKTHVSQKSRLALLSKTHRN